MSETSLLLLQPTSGWIATQSSIPELNKMHTYVTMRNSAGATKKIFLMKIRTPNINGRINKWMGREMNK